MLVLICVWTSQRSENRYRQVFKYAEHVFRNIKIPPTLLSGCRGILSKKFANFSRFVEFNQTHPLLWLLITNLDTSKLSDVRVGVYTSIFSKSPTLSLDVEITYLGYSGPSKLVLTIKDCAGEELGVYRPILPILSTLYYQPLSLKLQIKGVSGIKK